MKPRLRHRGREKRQKRQQGSLPKLPPKLRKSASSMRRLRKPDRRPKPKLKRSVVRPMKQKLSPNNARKRLLKLRLQPRVRTLPKHLRI